MIIPAYYLAIVEEYVLPLRGLRWSAIADAVEDQDGLLFAFREQIALFLEGFLAVRPLIHFAHILHLLHLVGHGAAAQPPEAQILAKCYGDLKRPTRNAGAFCATLCREIPSIPLPMDDQDLLIHLRHGLLEWGQILAEPSLHQPPFTPAAFEAHVLTALRKLRLADLAHWLRHGRGPIGPGGEQAAREILAARPRSLDEILGVLAQKQRLAGAQPYVAQLVSVLTLPPRRLADRELPMGGYADVATRGLPEQLLPSQFALDQIEFVRRFAENELLFFRREEPHARSREELVVLLDQGVRTWGDVRLVLSAAVLALGKLAERRGVPLLLAGTSTQGQLLDPVTADEKTLAALLEASDLSPQPGSALDKMLDNLTPTARDVILLSHPRNLRETEVAAAARRIAPGTRLYALAVDGHGESLFAELKNGAPIPLTRFRIDLSRRPVLSRQSSDVPRLAGSWQGDVEPIGFPFLFGVSRGSRSFLFDFDYEGTRLLAATDNGMLFASRRDGSEHEVLPRGFHDGTVLRNLEAVLGVAGGFAVAGNIHDWLVVARLSLGRPHLLGPHHGPRRKTPGQWFYIPQTNSVVVRKDELGVRPRPGYRRPGRLVSGNPAGLASSPGNLRPRRSVGPAWATAAYY